MAGAGKPLMPFARFSGKRCCEGLSAGSRAVLVVRLEEREDTLLLGLSGGGAGTAAAGRLGGELERGAASPIGQGGVGAVSEEGFNGFGAARANGAVQGGGADFIDGVGI